MECRICTFCSNLTISARGLLQTQNAVAGVTPYDIEIVASQRAARDTYGCVSCTLQHRRIAFELPPDLPVIECDGEVIPRVVGHAGDIGDQLLRAPRRSRSRLWQTLAAKTDGRRDGRNRWRRRRNRRNIGGRCRCERSLGRRTARRGTNAVGYAVVTGQPLQHARNGQAGGQLGG